MNIQEVRKHLLQGQAIPALPLALDQRRRWSPRHQKAVLRYYLDAGVGGIAVGVHSTQFEIRDPQHNLYQPVLAMAAEEIDRWRGGSAGKFIKIAGLCGRTRQASREAEFAVGASYAAGLLSLAAWGQSDEKKILRHCAAVAEIIPLIGFYLQPAVGGRALSYEFWREFARIPNVVAVKIAPFNRYQTLDVVRAVIDSGREDIALYTGNDDNIIVDLLTNFGTEKKPRYIAGGLLGQWGVWTESAVRMLAEIKRARRQPALAAAWLRKNAELTEANAVVFDAKHGFAGCIPGIHEILRRGGIFESSACLNPHEKLSPGQAGELGRVVSSYPWISDAGFVRKNLVRWLAE
jgi:dihydrodipicolinate synthase/N-acetylneuraminate lyase